MKRTAKAKAKQKPAKPTEDNAQAFALAAMFAALAVIDDRLDEDNDEVGEVWQAMLADLMRDLPQGKQAQVLKTAETVLAVIDVQVRP